MTTTWWWVGADGGGRCWSDLAGQNVLWQSAGNIWQILLWDIALASTSRRALNMFQQRWGTLSPSGQDNHKWVIILLLLTSKIQPLWRHLGSKVKCSLLSVYTVRARYPKPLECGRDTLVRAEVAGLQETWLVCQVLNLTAVCGLFLLSFIFKISTSSNAQLLSRSVVQSSLLLLLQLIH